MEASDLLSKAEWALFEKELYDRFGINAAAFDASGVAITGKPNWCNRLCPQIKSNKDSLGAICAPGNQAFMAEARQTQRPVIGECDAGFIKLAVPVFLDDTFLGTVGGCGLLPEEGDIEPFLVEKTLGMAEKEILSLCRGVGRMTEKRALEMVRFIEKHLDHIVDRYIRPAKAS